MSTSIRRNAAILAISVLCCTSVSPTEVEYGADVSAPMQHDPVSNNYPWLPHNVDPENNPTPDEYKGMAIQPLGDRRKFWKDFVQGCVDFYGRGGQACISTERDRVAMSLRQPQAMVNYTENGFKKIRAPPEVWRLISEFWEMNKDKEQIEKWGTGNTYTNNWNHPTAMVSVENSALRGGGYGLKQKIWNAAKDTLQEWTGEELRQCSLYGVRVYKDGAVLATHVDRLPLVSSAIINVAQDIDEPWPIEVIGHDGKAHNVTMEPGDMVLYESHSVLHGRPFPMKGRFYANLFVHFEPVGHSLRHHGIDFEKDDVDKKYKRDLEEGRGGHEHDSHDNNGMPTYILKGSAEEAKWKRSHPDNKRHDKSKPMGFATGSTEVHRAAQDGDVAYISRIAKKDIKQLGKKDSNGWQPLHEAARSGHTEVVDFLVKNGVNINERTNNGIGGSPLWLAEKEHGKNHPVVKVLKEAGALSFEPEL